MLVNACWLHEKAVCSAVPARHPDLSPELRPSDRRVAQPARRDALHWAAFHGNAKLVELQLPLKPSLEVTEADFQKAPLGWAAYGSEHGWNWGNSNYTAVIKQLLRAESEPPDEESGTPAVQCVFRLAKGC